MLIFDRDNLASREPELLCSFGITESIGLLLGSIGAGIGTEAGVGAGIGLGAGEAAAGSAFGGIAADAALGAGGGLIGSGAVGSEALGAGLGAAGLGSAAEAGLGGLGGVTSALGAGAELGTSALAAGPASGFGGVLGAGEAAVAPELTGAAGGIATPATSIGTGVGAGGVAAPAAAAPGGAAVLDAGTVGIPFAPEGGLTTGALSSSPATGLGEAGVAGAALPTPPIPPFGVDAAGISTAPAGSPGLGFGPGSWTPGVGDAAGTFTNTSSPVMQALQSVGLASSTGPGAAGGSGGGLLSGIGINSLKDVAPIVSLLGLGNTIMSGNKPFPDESALRSQAAQLGAQGNKLQTYIQNGTLPPGVGQSLKSAADSAKAQIRSRYAAMGGNTSAMQQDLANIDMVSSTQGADIALKLLNEGVSETQLSSQLYGQLLNLAVTQDAQLGQSIGNFASALAGGGAGRGTTINIPAGAV